MCAALAQDILFAMVQHCHDPEIADDIGLFKSSCR